MIVIVTVTEGIAPSIYLPPLEGRPKIIQKNLDYNNGLETSIEKLNSFMFFIIIKLEKKYIYELKNKK